MSSAAVYVRRPAPSREPLVCGHCGDAGLPPISYVEHVKVCVARAIGLWDEAEYSKRYFRQVRAISRFRHRGARSPYRAWAWARVDRPDGPVLTSAERSAAS